MMYTELYSFEGTAATDAAKTTRTLEKEKSKARESLKKRGGALEVIGSIFQGLTPGKQKNRK